MRIYCLLFILTFGCSQFVNGQIITTVAGIACMCYSGDGGIATAAALALPEGIAIDSSGNVFIADVNNSRIRKINPTGIITTVVGTGVYGYSGDGGPATLAKIGLPFSVFADKEGSIYLTDDLSKRVRKVDASGIITTFAGNGLPGSTGDGGPATAACVGGGNIGGDAAGNIYVTSVNRIRKINTAGIITTVAGNGIAGFSGDGGPATAAQMDGDVGLSVDAAGNIFICDENNYRIRKVNTAGIISTVAGTGAIGFSGDGGPATNAQLSLMFGVFVDAPGNVYIADGTPNSRVRMVNPSGIISTIAGSITGSCAFAGDGGPATAAQLCRPWNIARYGSGNIYFTDRNNNRVRMISNHLPYFVRGHLQRVSVCSAFTVTDTLLSVMDSNVAFTDIWTLVSPPRHGAAIAADTNVSAGGAYNPSGLSYTPLPGYTGLDTFRVAVADALGSDTTTIILNIFPAPALAVITGPDSVCPGKTVLLSDATAGGIWTSSNTAVAAAGPGTGILTGVSPGTAVISYTLSSPGCSISAVLPFSVRSISACFGSLSQPGTHYYQGHDVLEALPNPNDGAFTIRVLSGMDKEIAVVITDIVGIIRKELTIPTNKAAAVQLDAAPGVYFIYVHGAAGEKIVQRVVVRR